MKALIVSLIEVLIAGYVTGVLFFLLLGRFVFHRGVANMAREANASFSATLLLIAIRWPTLPWHDREQHHD